MMARANSNKAATQNGLPVLGENQDELDFSNSYNPRFATASSRSSSQASRRTPTPTKQISLTAVKRREDSFHDEDDTAKIEELRTSMKLEAERSFIKEPKDLPEFVVERSTGGSQVTKMKKRHNCVQNGDVETAVQKQPVAEMPKNKIEGQKTAQVKQKKKEEKEASSSSDEEDSDEEEERKAPNQLLMEFLECIYAKDFPNAAKLCKMILIYEPNHPVALQFQPVIEEKIQLDIEAEQEGSGESGSENDDDDEEDSGEDDDDGSDDDSDENDDDSGDENEEDEDENDHNSDDSAIGETEDSGIASTESSDRDNYYEM